MPTLADAPIDARIRAARDIIAGGHDPYDALHVAVGTEPLTLLATLTELQRETLVDHVLLGLSVSEIAEKQGRSRAAVSLTLTHARRKVGRAALGA